MTNTYVNAHYKSKLANVVSGNEFNICPNMDIKVIKGMHACMRCLVINFMFQA